MRFLVSIIVFTLSANVIAQGMREQYDSIRVKNDSRAEEQFLKKWEATNPNDPELYTAYFNYYASKSTPPTHQGIELNKKYADKAIEYANKGIRLFPSRLDMRFGKTSILFRMKEYGRYTDEIVKALDYSLTINCKWLWTDNNLLENGRKTMIDGMQGYIMQLFESKDENKLPHMLRIAETTFDDYPDDAGSMVNLSIVYLLWGQYDEALEILKEAESISPTDFEVLGNIAQVYRKKGDITNAKKYYIHIAEVCDEEAKAYAKQQLEKLDNEKQN